MGTSYVRLSDVFNHDAAVRLHTGGMSGDVIHILQGGMNHMALIGIHWLTTLPFTSIRRLLPFLPFQHFRDLTLQFTSIRRLLRKFRPGDTGTVRLAVHIHPQIVTAILPAEGVIHESCSSHPSADCYVFAWLSFGRPKLAVHIHPQIVTTGCPSSL